MESKYSKIIDPSKYETQGLCGEIPLRMHKYPQNEDIGTVRCQRDWHHLVSPLKSYKGGLHAKWNFMSVSVPECLPERLEIISYANEFAFLYDGMNVEKSRHYDPVDFTLDKTEDFNKDQVSYLYYR
jgi:hypothetical protein